MLLRLQPPSRKQTRILSHGYQRQISKWIQRTNSALTHSKAGDLALSAFKFADAPQLNDAARFEHDNISPASPLVRRWGEDKCGTNPELVDVTGSKGTEFSKVVDFYCHLINGRKAKTQESYPLQMHWSHTDSGPRMIYMTLTNTLPHPVTFDHKSCNNAFAMLMFGCAKQVSGKNGLFIPGGRMSYNGFQAYLGIGQRV